MAEIIKLKLCLRRAISNARECLLYLGCLITIDSCSLDSWFSSLAVEILILVYAKKSFLNLQLFSSFIFTNIMFAQSDSNHAFVTACTCNDPIFIDQRSSTIMVARIKWNYMWLTLKCFSDFRTGWPSRRFILRNDSSKSRTNNLSNSSINT